MNKCRAFIVLFTLLLFSSCAYSSYTIVDQLKNLRARLQELIVKLQGDKETSPVQKKLPAFFAEVRTEGNPLGIIYELFDAAQIVPSISKSALNVQDLTPVEKAAYQDLLQEFSDLLQEIDQNANREFLRVLIGVQLEDTLKRYVHKPEISPKIKNKKIQDRINALLDAINNSSQPLVIYEKLLINLRKILPQPGKTPVIFTPEEQNQINDIFTEHKIILNAIHQKKNNEEIKASYINQLLNAYQSERRRVEEQEETPPPVPEREEEQEEEDRPLPPLPTEGEPEGFPKEEEEGTIPPPPPLPETKEETETNEEEGTVPPPPPPPPLPKPIEKNETEVKKEPKKEIPPSERERSWEEIIKEAMDQRRGSLENEEEQEEQGEEEWNPWD